MTINRMEIRTEKSRIASGVIIPPEEIYIDSYIAQLDYDYPDPETGLGVTIDVGNRLVPVDGGTELIQIGLKGENREFGELPPLNLAFVIDKSGSMSQSDKMDWVKQSFDIFIDKVRPIDYVSLVVFDNDSKVLFPSTRMKDDPTRDRLRKIVQSVKPGGGTNLGAGAETGYREVMPDYGTEYTNRVLFLTDGMGSESGLVETAKGYKQLGVNISAIGLGKEFDLKLMTDLALAGGGSSRFISDRIEMEKCFGSELDRTVVHVARNLEINVELSENVILKDTWGYDNTRRVSGVTYTLDTLHNRDYETILFEAALPRLTSEGPYTIGSVTVSYTDLANRKKSMGPFPIECEASSVANTVAGYSNYRTIRSGGILERYVRIPGKSDGMSEATVADLLDDTEIKPTAPEQDIAVHFDGLFREILLQLPRDGKKNIAVADFSYGEATGSTLQNLIRECAQVTVGKDESVTLLERSDLDGILKEQELSLSALSDTDTAIEIGRLLSASHILTGTVLGMKTSNIVFARCIDTTTGEVVSVSQVILDRNAVEKCI